MYTKGKWTIEIPCGFPYSGLYVVPVIRKNFPYHIAKIRQLRKREESEANARLIAAAPDLLAACKIGLAIARWTEDVRGVPKALVEDIKKIEAIIKEAEGTHGHKEKE